MNKQVKLLNALIKTIINGSEGEDYICRIIPEDKEHTSLSYIINNSGRKMAYTVKLEKGGYVQLMGYDNSCHIALIFFRFDRKRGHAMTSLEGVSNDELNLAMQKIFTRAKFGPDSVNTAS